MTQRFDKPGRFGALLAAAVLALACDGKTNAPQTIDSQTNWLKSCAIDQQCGGYSCVCGVCTSPCGDDSACKGLDGSSCIASTDPGPVAQCGGSNAPALGMCLPHCDATTPCAKQQMCVAGVCTPVPNPSVTVTVDTTVTHQVLKGFGASLAYVEGQIANHPRQAALNQALFAGLGLDILRLRDRYGHSGDDDLTTTAAVVEAATKSLGRAPSLFMDCWSPSPALKANASVECSGNPTTCTLAKTAAGAFDYAGFASYWRKSLDAYAAVGIQPEFIGIQNNPNWLPTSAEQGEACVFLPTEGMSTVLVQGVSTAVSYPGYAEAQAAVVAALDGLASPPKILAPETSDAGSVGDYVAALPPGSIDAIGHHLYGTDPQAVDATTLSYVGALGTSAGLPVFQTEMRSDGLGTAILIHDTLAVEGASAYLQSTLTSTTGPAGDTQALVGASTTDFTLLDPYYAMQHFALHTDPGWTRVDANTSGTGVLASAWLSPGADALTIVLVNPGTTPMPTQVVLPPGSPSAQSTVTRTVFGGMERGVTLGSLSDEGVVRIPPRSVVTIALSD